MSKCDWVPTQLDPWECEFHIIYFCQEMLYSVLDCFPNHLKIIKMKKTILSSQTIPGEGPYFDDLHIYQACDLGPVRMIHLYVIQFYHLYSDNIPPRESFQRFC